MPFVFSATQDTKPLIRDKNGNEYVDFLLKDIRIQDPGDGPKGMNYYVVPGINAMRIDLISKDMYAYDTDYIEKILKFNEISNPLAIDEGDILIIYEPYSLVRNLRNTSNNANIADEVRRQYLTPEKKSQVDPNLQAFDKRNRQPERIESTNLPPNYADFGDQEIEIRGGKIYFGPNVSKSKQACEEPLSKSEFVARLVKNRLKNQ